MKLGLGGRMVLGQWFLSKNGNDHERNSRSDVDSHREAEAEEEEEAGMHISNCQKTATTNSWSGR